jgi:hypothetical protein
MRGPVVATLLTFLLGGAVSLPASACSCVLQSLRKEFREAHAVFVGQVVSSSHTPAISSTQRIAHETVVMDVLQNWKGPWHPGAKVAFSADIGPLTGHCELSAVYDTNSLVETQTGEPQKLSGIWVIFAFGPEPLTVSLCSRSAPIEIGGAELLWELSRFAAPKKAKKSASMRSNNPLHPTARRLLRAPGYPRSLCSLGAAERGR